MADLGGVHSVKDENQYATAVSSQSRLPLKKWLLLVHFWLRQFPVTTAVLDADISKSTAIDVYQWFREVCSTTLLNTPIVLGGNGVIVEIDESLFTHKPKVYVEIWVKTWGNCCALALAASPWASPSPSVMGLWNGGHFPGPSSWTLQLGCTPRQ